MNSHKEQPETSGLRTFGPACLGRNSYRGVLLKKTFVSLVALAFILLSAHGAAAEAEGYDRQLKANTRKTRVINLLRMGYFYIRNKGVRLEFALDALRHLVTLRVAPNWG